jgi:hypothetical protein
MYLMTKQAKWIITLIAAGILSYIIADIIHEVIGHAGICLLMGQKITLLSSVYFRSEPGSFVTDLGGPAANLLIGLAIFFFLKKVKRFTIVTAFFPMTVMSYNLFWFCGTIVDSGFSNAGDWSYATRLLNIGTLSEPVLLISGIIAYLVSVRMVKIHLYGINASFPDFPLQKAIYYAYTGAIAAAVIAGLMFRADRPNAAIQGALEMVSSLPVLLINGYDKTRNRFPQYTPKLAIVVIALIVFIFFCGTLGAGLTWHH